jgi:hypothetical protein
MKSRFKPQSEIPDGSAESIGLRKETNGFVAWLIDADGNEYRPTQWLLDLLHVERERGKQEALFRVRDALGIPECLVDQALSEPANENEG